MIQGMCKEDRWDAGKYIDERSLRSVWVNECAKIHESTGASYFIEKSPPNMMRIELIQSIFPSHILLVNNRDPYANISSMFYRYTENIDDLSNEDRAKRLEELAKGWIERSTLLKDIIVKQSVPYLSYENFCENPHILQDYIDGSAFEGKIKLNFESKLKVKDYEPQSLVNFNEQQIGKLTETDIQAISAILGDRKSLLSFFGYDLR